MIRIILLLIWLSLISMMPMVSAAEEGDFEGIVRHLQEQLRCDYQTAKSVVLMIDDFTQGIQGSLSAIASTEIETSKKRGMVADTINSYFEGPDSIVQVSSRNRRNIREYRILTYLTNLWLLSHNNGYAHVELLFFPDYLGFGRLEQISTSHFELSVSMWQIFKAYYGDGVLAYSDATRKKFRLNIYIYGDTVQVKTAEILVAETIDLSSFEEKFHWETP